MSEQELERIKDLFCRNYCKYPDIWDEEKEGCELAESDVCANCELNKLQPTSEPQIEIWKDIPEFEGIYQISNMGRVKSLSHTLWNGHYYFQSKEKILKAVPDNVGYPKVVLRNNGKRRDVRVHRLVAEAFIPNPYNYRVVNHLDGGRTNNRVDNLEWCSHRHNTQYAVKQGAFDLYRKKVKVVETGIIYPSIHECARRMKKHNVDFRHISDCLRGKLKSHKGFHFEEV